MKGKFYIWINILYLDNLLSANTFILAKPSPTAQLVVNQTSEQEVAGSIHDSANILSEDLSHFYKIHSSLASVYCFYNGCVGKQPVVLKEYCSEY